MAAVAFDGYISPNGTVAPSTVEDSVALPSERQAWLEAQRELGRTLMGGTAAMRRAGTKYVPQHSEETPEDYAARLKSTTLYNGFSMTVARQAGKLFMKPVTVEDADDTIIEFINDVDGEGRTITAFSNDAIKAGMVDGVAYMLVDFPQMGRGATQADVKRLGARPYWVLVGAERMLGWESQNVGGKHVLTQVRFREVATERVDEFTTRAIEQIRVLDIGGLWRVYRKVKQSDNKERWVVVKEGQASWTFIPMQAIYVNRSGFFEGLPPMQELAELNCEHWQSSSEQRRALSFLRFAMLAIIGQSPSKTQASPVIGPNKVLLLPVGGDAKYVEHNGQGIGAGLEDLRAIERRMQGAGMEVRIENAGQVTATAAIIDSSESNAALKAVAKGVEAALNEALTLTGAFLRTANTGNAKVYDEFAEKSDGTTSDFIALYGAQLVSRDTVWAELVRRHVLDDDFDPDRERVRLMNEFLSLQALAASGAAGEEDQATGEEDLATEAERQAA